MTDRRLAAVMVTDMVGFTSLMRADQGHALQILNLGHDILKQLVAEHGGEWLDDAGDRTLTAFPSAVNAVECARDIQERLKPEPGLNLRIGVDVGDIVVAGGHVYGDAVNTASFIERLGDPDGLVITEAAFEAVRNHIDLVVVDLGEKVLKNVDHPIRLYALTGSRRKSQVRGVVSGLLARRVPQIVGAYLAASWAFIEVTQWLADHGVFDGRWTFALMVGLFALVPSVLLVAYSHGAHGRDRITPTEKIAVPLNLLLAAALVAFVHQNQNLPAGDEPIEAASVAVLPFVDLSDDGSSGYFSLGLSEELINALARVPELYVSSRTSSFIFDGHDQDPREIARKLRVATILEGSVRKEGDKVRVTAQLIDGQNNFHLWSDTFNYELADIFVIQEEIASAVTRELMGILKPDSISVFSEARAATLQAYDFYLQGLNYLRQSPKTETLENARELLRSALAEDESYANAYAALCEVELQQYVLDRTAAAIDLAEEECLRAYRLDSASREVRFSLGTLYRHTGDYGESARIFSELLMEQKTPRAWEGLGRTADAQGEFATSAGYFQNAIDMEPGNWHNRMALAESLYGQGRYDEALVVFQQVVELSPDNVRAHLLLGATYDYLGDLDAAIAEIRQANEISPSRGAYRDLGLTYHSIGDYDKAVDAYRQAIEIGADDYATWGSLGDSYLQMPDREAAAIAAYQRAAELAAALLERNPRDWLTMADLAFYNVMTGAEKAGIERITTAVANGPHLPFVHYQDAVIHKQLSQTVEALDALENAVKTGYPKLALESDPQFSSYRNDERFIGLIGEKMEE